MSIRKALIDFAGAVKVLGKLQIEFQIPGKISNKFAHIGLSTHLILYKNKKNYLQKG